MEDQNTKLHSDRQVEINASARQAGLSTPPTPDQLLKEIKSTMSHRKKLLSQVTQLETEVTSLEKNFTPTQNVSVLFSNMYMMLSLVITQKGFITSKNSKHASSFGSYHILGSM